MTILENVFPWGEKVVGLHCIYSATSYNHVSVEIFFLYFFFIKPISSSKYKMAKVRYKAFKYSSFVEGICS